MEPYVALSFQTPEDFEICNLRMNVPSKNIAIAQDGMITVLVKTETVLFPHGTLVITTNRGRRIFVRVVSGRKIN
jgi:hypothetical protein